MTYFGVTISSRGNILTAFQSWWIKQKAQDMLWRFAQTRLRSVDWVDNKCINEHQRAFISLKWWSIRYFGRIINETPSISDAFERKLQLTWQAGVDRVDMSAIHLKWCLRNLFFSGRLTCRVIFFFISIHIFLRIYIICSSVSFWHRPSRVVLEPSCSRMGTPWSVRTSKDRKEAVGSEDHEGARSPQASWLWGLGRPDLSSDNHVRNLKI